MVQILRDESSKTEFFFYRLDEHRQIASAPIIIPEMDELQASGSWMNTIAVHLVFKSDYTLKQLYAKFDYQAPLEREFRFALMARRKFYPPDNQEPHWKQTILPCIRAYDEIIHNARGEEVYRKPTYEAEFVTNAFSGEGLTGISGDLFQLMHIVTEHPLNLEAVTVSNHFATTTYPVTQDMGRDEKGQKIMIWSGHENYKDVWRGHRGTPDAHGLAFPSIESGKVVVMYEEP